jgi:hypothetical protein
MVLSMLSESLFSICSNTRMSGLRMHKWGTCFLSHSLFPMCVCVRKSMYENTYTCVCICDIHTHTYAYIHIHVHICVYMYTCIYTHTHTCIHIKSDCAQDLQLFFDDVVRMQIDTHTHTYTHIHTCNNETVGPFISHLHFPHASHIELHGDASEQLLAIERFVLQTNEGKHQVSLG